MSQITDKLEKFSNTKPEIVFEWNDRETDATGWLVINTLHGGAAGGGTRMRKGLDRNEVASLAKTMEIKFTVSGPGIGGAKSGINFDPSDPKKDEVLKRWFKAVTPILKNYYGTGGDLNIDEIKDVIPCTEAFGIVHPQEGIINGHFCPNEAGKIDKISQLRRGVCLSVKSDNYCPTNSEFTVADLITGYGVAESVKHYYLKWGGVINKKSAIIQGWGNVGAAAAFYLAKMGVRILGISDKDGGVFNNNGYGLEEISKLFLDRKGNVLVSADKMAPDEINKLLWTSGAQIFIPAAASRLVSKEQVEAMSSNDLEVIACGANVPFKDEEIFFGPITQLADNKVSLIPDFVANCGMARVFSYLMQDGDDLSEEAIFSDTSKTIDAALQDIYNVNPSPTQITKTAFEIALQKIQNR